MDTTPTYINKNSNVSAPVTNLTKQDSVIPVQTVNTPQTKASIPPVPTQDYSTYLTQAQSQQQALQNQITQLDQQQLAQAQQTLDPLYQQEKSLQSQLSGKGAEQISLEQAANLPVLKQQLSNLNAQLLQKTQAYNAEQYNSGAAYGPSVKRDAAIELSMLSASANALQGNITAAQTNIDNAINLKYSDLETQLGYTEKAIDRNFNLMTDAQKTQAEDVRNQLKTKQEEVAQEKSDMQKLLQNAVEAGAPSSLITKALKSNDINEAIQTLGIYGGGLEAQLKSAQITKAYAEAKKAAESSGGGSTEADLAQQLVNGQLAPSQLSKRTSNYNAVITAADAYSMKTTGKHFNAAQAERDYKYANNQGTLNTLNYLKSLTGTTDTTGNLQELQNLSNNISRTNFPALNKVEQWSKLQAGDANLAAYYATITEVSDQVAKILQGGGTGSGTSDAKLKQAQELFNTSFNKKQVDAVINSLKPLLTNRAKALIGDNPYLNDYAQEFGFKTFDPITGQENTSSGNSYTVGETNKIINNQGTTSTGVKFTIEQ